MTGRKELRRRSVKRAVKSYGSTVRLFPELADLRMEEVAGIPSVGVKSVDIRRNTNGVGRLLVHF